MKINLLPKNSPLDFARWLSKNNYLFHIFINIFIYGLIYKILGFEWMIVVAVAWINTDLDVSNFINWRNKIYGK